MKLSAIGQEKGDLFTQVAANGTCIIILDKSIIQQIVHVTSGHMAVYGLVHILPYDPQCHETCLNFLNCTCVHQIIPTNHYFMNNILPFK
jgi:hypothetical protein